MIYKFFFIRKYIFINYRFFQFSHSGVPNSLNKNKNNLLMELDKYLHNQSAVFFTNIEVLKHSQPDLFN